MLLYNHTLGARASSCDRSEDTTRRLSALVTRASSLTLVSSIFRRTLFVIGLNLCEPFHWLTDERRLTNEKTHINFDQSQTEFKY